MLRPTSRRRDLGTRSKELLPAAKCRPDARQFFSEFLRPRVSRKTEFGENFLRFASRARQTDPQPSLVDDQHLERNRYEMGAKPDKSADVEDRKNRQVTAHDEFRMPIISFW